MTIPKKCCLVPNAVDIALIDWIQAVHSTHFLIMECPEEGEMKKEGILRDSQKRIPQVHIREENMQRHFPNISLNRYNIISASNFYN